MPSRQTLIQKLQERLGKRQDNTFPTGVDKNTATPSDFHKVQDLHTQADQYQFQAEENENSDVSMTFNFEGVAEAQLQRAHNAASGGTNDVYASMPLAPMVQDAPAMFPAPEPAPGTGRTSSSGSRWPCPRLSISEQSPPCAAYVGPKDMGSAGGCQVSVWDMVRPPSAPSPGWRPLCGSGGPKAAASPSSILGLLTPGSRAGGASLTWDTLRPAVTPGAGGFSTPGLCLGGLAGTPGSAAAAGGGGGGATGFTPRFGWAGDWASPAAGSSGGWGADLGTEAMGSQSRRRAA